jgi:phytoene dehydrogenase-like protein
VLESGEQIEARAVVSAIDPKRTLLRLVEPGALDPSVVERMQHVRARGVTAKINLALSALPAFTALGPDAVPFRGRFLIAPSLDYIERAFDAAKYGAFSPRPWIELAMPSVLDETLAPAGAHVASIYVQFAPRQLRETTWSDQREALYRTVVQAIEEHAPQFGQLIIGREILTPEDLERDWNLPGGHLFHGETTLDQSWIARPLLGWSNYRTPLEGLYLASAGTHPGGGLTGASGLMAARALLHDLRRRRP